MCQWGSRLDFFHSKLIGYIYSSKRIIPILNIFNYICHNILDLLQWSASQGSAVTRISNFPLKWHSTINENIGEKNLPSKPFVNLATNHEKSTQQKVQNHQSLPTILRCKVQACNQPKKTTMRFWNYNRIESSPFLPTSKRLVLVNNSKQSFSKTLHLL